MNAALFYENKDPRTFVSLVPTSAHTGDGMGSLIYLLVELTQTMLSKRLAHCEELRAQVMEVMINFSVYCFFFLKNIASSLSGGYLLLLDLMNMVHCMYVFLFALMPFRLKLSRGWAPL